MEENKLLTLIVNNEISVEELAKANELIESAKLVCEAIEACKKILFFPLGTTEIRCYYYMDSAGEYCAWGECTNDGIFKCFGNWGGDHEIGKVNLMSFKDVFLALNNDNEFKNNLERFLKKQIEKAKKLNQ